MQPSAEPFEYTRGDLVIPMELIRSRRRTIGISIHAGGVVRLRVPRGTPRPYLIAVLRRKEAWILRKQRELRDTPPRIVPTWQDGMCLRVLGRPVALQTILDPGVRRRRVVLTRTRLLVYTGRAIDSRALHRAVLDWYRRRASRIFAARVAALRRDPGIRQLGPPGPLGVRRMRRRWGSCFRDHRIVLNIELLAEPLDRIDYVIVHELCHLREHNHSPRFYRHLERVMPDWRTRREALHRSTTAGFLTPPEEAAEG